MLKPKLLPLYPVEYRTERLLIRPFRRRDASALHAAVRDSITELQEFLPWAALPFGYGNASGFIRESIKAWREGRAYDFTVRLLDQPDIHIANISIWVASRSSQSGEIGYWTRTGHTGRGIATEAGRQALRIGFHELNLHRMILRIAVGNHGSEQVATNLGFVKEGVLREEVRVGSRWLDHSVWGILEHEFPHSPP